MDRVYELTYPDNEALTHSYAGNGLLSQIASSIGPTNYLSSAQYNALNLPAQYTLGSGTTALVTHTYYGPDASGYPYGALKTIRLQQGANPRLVDRDISYDKVGNVTSIADAVNSETITYSYDDLDRLQSASAPSGESYTYDEIGNIASKNSLSYTYDSAHKHAIASYNGTSYSYDANGNMTSRGDQMITYDPENRPVRVEDSGPLCRFAYHGDGIRRKRLDVNGTIHYVGAYERNVGNGQDTTEVITKYYLGLGRLIALRRAGTLYYAGTDHLGSTIRVADTSFSAVDAMRYKPFGGDRDAGTDLKTDHKFTSQIEDASIGLYWYASRAYDPAIGRFVAPDTIVPEAGNPQTLNRYAYTRNNPLRYTDPTGHDVEDWFDQSWLDEFNVVHGRDPDANDYAYRYFSMAWRSGAIDGQYHTDQSEKVPFDIPREFGADMGQNIKYAIDQSSVMSTPGSLGSMARFAELVRDGGAWDYKRLGGFENYGNFNYGATAAAWGFPEGIATRAAGTIQLIQAASDWIGALFNSKQKVRPHESWPLGSAPFGDAPNDYPVIRAGFDFYRALSVVRPEYARPPAERYWYPAY